MPRRSQRHEVAFGAVIVWVGSAGYCLYSAVRGELNTAIWAGCVFVAIPAWLFALRAPTRCGVTTKRGHPCPNPTYGVLFGCGSAYGHTWSKFFTRFGWHRPVIASGDPAKPFDPGDVDAVGQDEAPLVRIQEDAKSRVTFVLAVVATGAALVSMGTDVAGVFR